MYTKNIKAVHFFIVLIILSFCEWFFFRNIIGNDSLIGSIVDGRYTNLVTEHWFQFFCGHESFKDLPMFYPIKGTLGYSDMLFGHGLIYCILRFLGNNIFDSYKYALIFVHLFGTYTTYYLFNKKFNFSMLLSLLGTIAFSFSQSYAYHIRHTQFIAISYLPILLICTISLINAFEIRQKRNLYMYLDILIVALIAYTSWYVAFFLALFLMIFFSIFLILLLNKPFFWKNLLLKIKIIKFDFIGYIVFLTTVFIPFLYVYIPVLKEKGGYAYTYTINHLPEPIDLINVPKHNLALGPWIYNSLHLTERGFSLELIQGFSPVLLFIFAIGLILLRQKDLKEINTSIMDIIKRTCQSAIGPAILVCILITLKLSSNGVSLWYFIYKLVPAGQSIRVPARFFLFLQFPISITITIYCKELLIKMKYKNVILCILIGITFFFNISLQGVSSFWNKNDQIVMMQNISSPPEECIAFYLIDTVNEIKHSGEFQTDAFEIATIYRIPTINGISGQIPNDWDDINNPFDKLIYEQAIFDWVESKKLRGIFAYDLGTNKWISIDIRKEMNHK